MVVDGTTTVQRDAILGVRHGCGTSFGTFGELLQGALSENEDFLVTLPIARWSSARITLVPGSAELVVEPEGKRKALRVAELMLARHGVSTGGTLVLRGDLPEGKGMSSSSADLVATVRAVADALGVTVPPREIEAYLRGIEPTDGLMYREVVAFYHRRVELCRVLGPVPALSIVGVDEGGQVDTVSFNSSRPAIAPPLRREYRVLLDDLATAMTAGDLATLGRVVTRSAVLNQDRCHKTFLDPVLRICRDIRALGVVVAHSGTLVGVMVSHDDPDHALKVAEAEAACGELTGAVSLDHTLGAPRRRGPAVDINSDAR
jgi:uncharacterized protein involved in propanediol utilization